MMAGLEQRKLPYLFTLCQSKNVSRTIAQLARQGDKVDWQSSGQGWESLLGWTRERRMIVSRQKTAEQKVEAGSKGNKQPVLPGTMVEQSGGDWYEYSVLVTSWEERDLRRLTQEYRNRADAENMFDELKNQGGLDWVHDAGDQEEPVDGAVDGVGLQLVVIFTRMGTGGQHLEAITTRPALIEGVAQRTEHAREVAENLLVFSTADRPQYGAQPPPYRRGNRRMEDKRRKGPKSCRPRPFSFKVARRKVFPRTSKFN